MPKRDETLLRWLGFNTQGDLGPWTFYTDKRKGLVFFEKAPPLEPPSQLQTTMRNAFRLVAYTWRSLPQSVHDDWELVSKRAYLKINGYNLFTYWSTTKDDPTIHTLERLTQIRLLPLIYA